MNLSNISYVIDGNVSNIINGVRGIVKDYPIQCYDKGKYSLECLSATICPQFNNYFINYGIGIVIAFIILSWVKWWFFKYGYLRFPYFEKFDRRVYWSEWVNTRIQIIMLMYIVIVVWLSINMKI